MEIEIIKSNEKYDFEWKVNDFIEECKNKNIKIVDKQYSCCKGESVINYTMCFFIEK